MKVIILENIKGFAQKYEIKEVKDGYARNFLFPRKLARPADESALKELNKQKSEWEKKEKETREKLAEIAKEIEKEKLVFELKTGEKGEAFGSVSKEDIKKRIQDKGNFEIILKHPIKSLGEHEVEVDLSKGIRAKLKISVKPEN
jgi:large subunit ribosomal protein L9